MDTSVLVESGHNLIELLEQKGLQVRAAMWVHNTDVDTWKLWIVPRKGFKDQREFYRKVVEVVSQNRDKLSGIEAADTEMVPDTHPAIADISKIMKVSNRGTIQIANTKFNDFYLTDGIILRTL